MRELRLRWHDAVSHAEHDVQSHAQWAAATPTLRTDLAIIVKTANELYGARSHWIEERERRQADSRIRPAFANHPSLQSDDAASAYTQQITAGFALLRFHRTLEVEFADHLHDSQRWSALIWGLLALGLSSVWVAVTGSDQDGNDLWIARGIVAVSLAAGVFLLTTRRLGARTDLIAILLLVPVVSTTVMQALLHLGSYPELRLFAAFLAVSAAFFPMGLKFVQTLPTVALVLLGCAAASFAVLPSEVRPASFVVAALLLLTAALAAVSGYFRELLQRRMFLIQKVLTHQACVDSLTGLRNRRGADQLTEIALLQAVRDGVPLSFVAIELGELDPEIHRETRTNADAMLVRIAQTLSAFGRRPLDVVSRMDGNGFGLLLYDCNHEQALLRADRLQGALQGAFVRTDAQGQPISVVSRVHLGVVEVWVDETAQQFYQRASKVLREARDRLPRI